LAAAVIVAVVRRTAGGGTVSGRYLPYKIDQAYNILAVQSTVMTRVQESRWFLPAGGFCSLGESISDRVFFNFYKDLI
jgi:hypothetical protein